MSFYTHNLNPVILHMGPLQVRWYGLMYLIGFSLGYFILANRHKRGQFAPNIEQIQSLITYLMIGMLIGARLVYVVVYNPENYLQNPFEIIEIWKGGLSFHGAALGFIVATVLFARKYGFGFYHVMDSIVFGSAQGIIWGRIGNFINGELYGRPTNVPWAVIFPQGGSEPRHPSQIYQSLMEGLCVFLILILIEYFERKRGYAPPCITPDPANKIKKYQVEWKRTGILSCSFLILYGIARFIIEFFREPDAQLGFYFKYFSMGQILCAIMILVGTVLLIRRIKKPIPEHYTITVTDS